MSSHTKYKIDTRHALMVIMLMIGLTGYCQIAGLPIVIPLLLLFSGIHLHYFKQANGRLFLHLGLLLALIVFTAHFLTTYTSMSKYYIPLASVVMLTMLLFNDLQLSFLMSFISIIIVTLIIKENLSFMLIFFFGGLIAAYTVREARTRGQLISAGFYVGIVHVAGMVLFNPDLHFILTRDFFINYLRPLMINGVVSAFIVMALLKIFEFAFGVLTNFSLLELSDFNHPLLKRMILEAPGTYHHSLIVSNLAETAADEIGANALLTRVGAYYHDIGKMEKPEYFTENQLHGGNKHDNIEPSISRLVILNHVKEGIELGKKYRLNPRIIDFIPQHHGTSLMHFFYQRALEEAEDEKSVREENYRYPGPKPQSKETAVVLLADSVEGATRSLDEPTPHNIEDVVRKVINNKFIDGQLDECNLTLKEIDKISRTFIRVLSAMYHSRIKYPEKKDDDDKDNSRKSAEKNSSKFPLDKEGGKKNS